MVCLTNACLCNWLKGFDLSCRRTVKRPKLIQIKTRSASKATYVILSEPQKVVKNPLKTHRWTKLEMTRCLRVSTTQTSSLIELNNWREAMNKLAVGAEVFVLDLKFGFKVIR